MNAELTPAIPVPTDSAVPAFPPQTEGAGSRSALLMVCAVLVVLVFAVFAQTCWFDFVNYDDNIAVYENPFVRAGLTAKSLKWAFSFNDYEYWIPLTSVSHILDVQLFGMKAGGHHLTNVVMHAASAVLLFLALRRLTKVFWCSAFVAAVFAIHPLRAESIGWVVERKDLLAGLFFMLALFFYGPGWRRGVAVMGCFLLGFLSKPMVITLPFLLLLLDFWPGGRISRLSDWKKPVIEKLPMLVLIPFLAILTVIGQGHAPGAIQTLENNSMLARLANALMSCVIYIKQTFYPVDLVVFYSRTEVHNAIWAPVLAGLAVSAVSIVAFVYRRKHPFLLTGWLWYLGMLVPVLGLISIGTIAHADRYTYFPQIGLLIMIAFGMAALWPRAGMVLKGGAVAVIAVLATLCFFQTKHWRDSETLWNYTLNVNPTSLLAHNNLGTVLYDKHDVDGARMHFEKALEINPDFPQAHNNLGMILSDHGPAEEAIPHFEKALAKDPDFAEAHNNLGRALRKIGKLDDAVVHFKKAVQLQPKYALAQFNLGKTLLMQGKFSPAADAFLAGLKLQPAFLGNRAVQKDVYDIAWTLATSPDDSVRNGSKAIEVAELGYVDSHGNVMMLAALAAAYADSADFPNAVSTAQRAIQMANERRESDLATTLQEQLKSYEAKKPWREAAKQN